MPSSSKMNTEPFGQHKERILITHCCRTNFFRTALRNTFAGYHVTSLLYAQCSCTVVVLSAGPRRKKTREKRSWRYGATSFVSTCAHNS